MRPVRSAYGDHVHLAQDGSKVTLCGVRAVATVQVALWAQVRGGAYHQATCRKCRASAEGRS